MCAWSDKKFNENQSGPIWASCAWRGVAVQVQPGFSLIMRLNRIPGVNRIAANHCSLELISPTSGGTDGIRMYCFMSPFSTALASPEGDVCGLAA
jgi:hypothetical protein